MAFKNSLVYKQKINLFEVGKNRPNELDLWNKLYVMKSFSNSANLIYWSFSWTLYVYYYYSVLQVKSYMHTVHVEEKSYTPRAQRQIYMHWSLDAENLSIITLTQFLFSVSHINEKSILDLYYASMISDNLYTDMVSL